MISEMPAIDRMAAIQMLLTGQHASTPDATPGTVHTLCSRVITVSVRAVALPMLSALMRSKTVRMVPNSNVSPMA